MNTSNNTLYIDSCPSHLAEALVPLFEKIIPTLKITQDKQAFFRLTLRDKKITLTHGNSSDTVTLTPPLKVTALIQHIQKIYTEGRPIHIGPYVFDYGARTLCEGDTTLHLTEKEAEVLSYLDQNRGKGISRDNLLKNVWGYADGIDTHTIETHIYRLRQKIEKNPVETAILLTFDDGYQLVVNS